MSDFMISILRFLRNTLLLLWTPRRFLQCIGPRCVNGIVHAMRMLKALYAQSHYDLSDLKNGSLISIIFVQGGEKINGGIMSCFSIAENSRSAYPGVVAYVSTFPNDFEIYAQNKNFPNAEKVLRWSQVVRSVNREATLILHVPEYAADSFYERLDQKSLKFLSDVRRLKINILNQNIHYMPPSARIRSLYRLTSEVTQTTAHIKYSNQDVCNRFGLPLLRLGTYQDYNRFKKYQFSEKEKIIAYSPDHADPEGRAAVLQQLAVAFPNYKLIEIQGLTFMEYMDLIARAYFVISFGEGYDAYFTQPSVVGSVGFSVYNKDFFPSPIWMEKVNVFSSYEEMRTEIVLRINSMLDNPEKYYEAIDCMLKASLRLSKDEYLKNLHDFYAGNFSYYPYSYEVVECMAK